MTRNTSLHLSVTACALAAGLALPSVVTAQAQTTPRNQAPVVVTQTPTPDRQIVIPDPQIVIQTNDTNKLEDQITFRLDTDELTRKYHIDVDAEGNVVTLSGEVATERQKTRALELAKVDGVIRIEDKIEVDRDADTTLADRAKRGLNKAGETISDRWITTKVSWFFVGEDVLDGSDINVDTDNRVVTLKGRVPSQAARVRATALARQTEGVRDVRDELVISAAR